MPGAEVSSRVRRREEIFVKERTERREERGQLGHYPLLPPASVMKYIQDGSIIVCRATDGLGVTCNVDVFLIQQV